MNVTLTSLEALILKATNEILSCPDSAALEAFCSVMKSSPDGPQLASQALAARIHSSNPREALLALTMIDQCLRRGDPNFLAEIGKFRFLNEMIKLVSPKYFANRTPVEVRSRVLQLFHTWSFEYEKETKFKVAYDMLKNQGVVKDTPAPPTPEVSGQVTKSRPHNAVFEDEEKSKLLQKLLQSKKPEDLQHANRLIKTMVKEEEVRTTAHRRCSAEVVAARESGGVLREMVMAAREAGTVPRHDLQLIEELLGRCARMRPRLHDLAAMDTHADDLEDILEAIDLLDDVFEQHRLLLIERRKQWTQANSAVKSSTSNGEALLDFAGAPPQTNSKTSSAAESALADLGDIFAAEGQLQNIVEPIKPVNVPSKDDVDMLGEKSDKAEVGWSELDSLGRQLMQQSLPENAKRLDGFISKSSKKIPMNALEKSSPNNEVQTSSNSLLDLDFFTQKPKDTPVTSSSACADTDDDVIVDISTNSDNNPCDSILDIRTGPQGDKCDEKIENKVNDENPLGDIEICLQSVKPSKVPPKTIFHEEGGVTVTLHYCLDKPREDVFVLVFTITSEKTSPIEEFKFQPIVAKPCKVRLLPATGSSLPGRVPFCPPYSLLQGALLWRPRGVGGERGVRATLRYLLTYTCQGDTSSEIGDAGDLALDDL